MASYFVTATGTDIGKTYVTAGIIRAGLELGRNFSAIKPLISGYSAENAAASDPAFLLAAMGKRVTHKNIAAISPWRFSAPLSPHLAAAREGKTIDFDAMAIFCNAAITAAPGPLLIEGAGGAAVPIDHPRLTADFIAALKIPAILVAGTYLGTLSHTITATESLIIRGIPIAAIVLSESLSAPLTPTETAEALAPYLPHPVHIIPRDLNDRSFRELAAVL
jgi:dethiobiotin synthetase